MSITSEISGTGQIVYDASVVKKVNTLLNSPKTRAEGLELLNSFLPHCSDDDFIKYCVSWMHSCCKTDGLTKNRDYGIKLLGTLFKLSSNYEELKKSVSFFITTRYFDYVFKYYQNSELGWICTEICITCYKGACGPFQETLEKHLKNDLLKNWKILPTVARCYALFPSIGGGGNENVNYWKNWKNQFRKFLNVCHLILKDLFADVEEFQEFETFEDLHWEAQENQKDPGYLTFQLYNHCSILNQMLLCKYPSPKSVPTDLVFQLICRGLSINPKSFGKRQTTNIIALQKVLPEIHIILLSLLKALIVTCKNQLLPYAHLVCKLMRQRLEWTGLEVTCGSENPLGEVRISVYEALCNWLAATRSGGCVETIANIVVANATADISTKKDIVVLKESKQKQQYKEPGNRRINPRTNDKLCFAALKALQFLLKFVGALIKPEEHKFLQEFTVKLLVDIQKTITSDVIIPFSVSKCRKELYMLLLELVQNPCFKWPPPTHFALRLLGKGIADESPEVSLLCSSALNTITNLIHPQYNNGGFPPNEAPETRKEWTSQAMEIDVQVTRSECDIREKSPESDLAEQSSNLGKSDDSLGEGEDSVKTVHFNEENEELEAQEESERLEIVSEIEKLEEQDINEPSPKKPRMWDEFREKTPVKIQDTPEKKKESPAKAQDTVEKKKESPVKSQDTPEKNKESPVKTQSTPEKKKETLEKEEKESPGSDRQEILEKESKKSEDSSSVKSSTPEVSEGIKPKKTYFLRSTTKASSEEPEEVRSIDNLKNTPLRGLKATPKRPKTRALSKVDSESETESKTTKKSEDDEDDIMAAFDDSIIE